MWQMKVLLVVVIKFVIYVGSSSAFIWAFIARCYASLEKAHLSTFWWRNVLQIGQWLVYDNEVDTQVISYDYDCWLDLAQSTV